MRDRRRLEPLADTDVLTHPPYRLEDPVVGVNLRWYLASSIYRKLVQSGYSPGRIVFTSLHADSLHPSEYPCLSFACTYRFRHTCAEWTLSKS